MAASSPLSTSSFEKALENFKSKSGLTSKELLDMEMTTLSDLQKSLATMQKNQQGSKKMMHLRRLQPFLDAMEQYSMVINIFVNTSGLVAFIWGPMKFLLIVASNFSEAFNALLEGYLSIGEHIPLLVQYRQLFETNQYMQTALASIFEDVLEFHLEAVKLFKQTTWKQLYHATGRSLKRRIEEITKSLQRHKTIIEAQATLVEYEEFQASHAYMKAEFAKLQSSEKDRRRTRVQDWLGSTIDSRTRHQDASKDRFSNTGQWLLQDQRFKNWFGPNQCIDPLVWLHGIPGAGKTVLASLVVEEASKVYGAISVCFYCKHTDEQRNGFLAVAKSVISQILPRNDSILDYLYEEASKSGEAILSTTALARELLEVALKSCKKVYIVLDGLDEYSRNDRKELASWFQQLISGLPKADFGSIRCLFVSQEDGFARKDLSMLSQIKITPAENKADIESFCKEWHQKIEFKFGTLEKREHHVTNVVSARAQGMFLYAKLVTWNLHEQTSRADFEAEIDPERVPDGLDQAYDRIIERLVGPAAPLSRRNNIRKLLGWLACARRPLKWYEIQGAVTVDLDNGMISAKHRFREDCKDLCASLVDITSDQTVTLVHSTTKQYLIRNSFIQVPEVECDLAILCLVYLSMAEFEIDKSESEIEEAYLRGVYAFADYAACFWALHTESALSEWGKQASNRVELISECLEAFLDMHWVDTGKTEEVSNTLQERLAVLHQHQCYERACQAVAAAKSWLRPAGKGPSDDNVLQLPRAMSQIRAILERMTSSPSISTDTENFILQHYGSNHYKCTRMNCQFFHRGFTSNTQRDQHIAKHDRSFACVWEGCPYEIIGFAASKDLQKHVFDHHGIKTESDKLEFPEGMPSTSRRNQKHPATFQCHLCPRNFTRAYNLRSHLRSHTDERPFVCAICCKAFSRQHDRKRHEGLHSGEKKFVCRGELETQPGQSWGCGRRFARAEALGLHFRSEAGRVCIDPLLKEKEAERLLKRQMQQPQSQLNPMNQATQDPSGLPEELLAKYPALRNIDWIQAVQAQSTDDPYSDDLLGLPVSSRPNPRDYSIDLADIFRSTRPYANGDSSMSQRGYILDLP